MALDEYLESEVAVAIAATAVTLSPRARRVVRRGAARPRHETHRDPGAAGRAAVRRLGTRVATLGGRLAPPCRACHWWDRTTVLCDEGGTCTRPLACPDCGRVVPIARAIAVVGVDLGRV